MNRSFLQSISLEILHRLSEKKNFHLEDFHRRDLAKEFLLQQNGRILTKGEKLFVYYRGRKVDLIVRELFYESNERANPQIEFIYQPTLFSQIKWPSVDLDLNRLTTRKTFSDEFPYATIEPHRNQLENQLKMISDRNENHYRSSIFLQVN